MILDQISDMFISYYSQYFVLLDWIFDTKKIDDQVVN